MNIHWKHRMSIQNDTEEKTERTQGDKDVKEMLKLLKKS